MNGSLVGEGGKDRPPKATIVPPRPPPPESKGCCRTHLNSLWSMWYGITVCGLHGYIVFHAAMRFLEYLDLEWPTDSAPRLELHAYVTLTSLAVLLLPVFLFTAVFKVGNMANDGFKLGRSLSACSAEPPSSVSLGAGGPRGFWRHSGPTAPLLHIIMAFCLLLPRLLVEARLIQAGFLPKDMIWRTDLDFLLAQRDRLVVLSFMTSSPNVNVTFLPTPLPQDTSSESSSQRPQSLPLTVGIPDQDLSLSEDPKWGPVSPELLNYALALFVYAIHYPAVFWNTNKWFGTLFSIQLLMNGVQCLLMYAGVCVLYKVHVVGPAEALPLLHQRVGFSPSMPQHFLLNRDVTLALFIFSTLLVIKSSLVLYLYGYGRLNAFVNRERARRVISLSDSEAGRGWSYFTHCAALCVLVAMAVCEAPLLYDSTVVYRGSLSSAVLACVVGSVVHLFLWVLLWLILTVKQHWRFKLRVTIGRATVRSARSIKLVTEVDLLSTTDYAQPLLVVGNGRTYTISDSSPKKAIMGVIQKCTMEKKAREGQGSNGVNAKEWMDREEEQIYWLRPKQTTPKHSPDSTTSSDRLEWLRKPTNSKHKVTFDPSSKKCRSSKVGESEDDGDYARLRELPMRNSAQDQSDGDTCSEDNKLMECVRTAAVTYARTNCDLLNPRSGDYEDPSPLLTPDPHEDILPHPPPGPSPPPPPPPASAANELPATPRCLRRADSGMPPEELTPRSDSPPEQSEIGGSPPDNSETSSGVHSNSSRESASASAQRRSTSVDDLATDAANKVQVQWKSVSLQRGMLPPQPDQSYNAYRAQNGNNLPHAVDPTYGILRNNTQSAEPTYIVRNNSQNTEPTYVVRNTLPQNTEPPYIVRNTLPQNTEPTYIIRNNSIQSGEPTYVVRNNLCQKDPTYSNMVPRVSIQPQEPIYIPYRPQQLYTKSPPVINEEEDVVIRRRVSRPETTPTSTTSEPFGRSTNMRLSSFKDRPHQSATLPHYPTQVVNPMYPHCSTMPLPVSNPSVPTILGTGNSCNSFPRQHTTIPTHHNGVRLFNPNPYSKRLFSSPIRGYAPPDQRHHTFPQIINFKPNMHLKSERDSANFSIASSNDSDSHT